MIVFFTCVNLMLIFLLARWAWRSSGKQDSKTYWSGLCFRLLCGLLVGMIYQFYYNQSGDTFVFFKDAARLTELGYSDPSEYLKFIFADGDAIHLITTEPRSLFFVAILSLINFVTGSNYWLSSLWFSLFSFWASWRLVMKLDQVFPFTWLASRIALLFLPSVVFWSSGIIKESIAFGAIAILSVHFLSLIRGHKLKWNAFVEIPLYIYLLLSLKYYWGAVLLPSMISSLIVYFTVARKWRSAWATVAAWVGVFGVLSLLVSLTHPNFYMERFLSVIIENNNEFVAISRPANVIHYYNLSDSWVSIFINSPWALISGLFRPFILEVDSLTGLPAALENLVILMLLGWKLKSLRMPADENRLIIFTAIAYVAILCVFLALSTPNLGTLSRYRIAFLPFFMFLILAHHPLFEMKWFRNKD